MLTFAIVCTILEVQCTIFSSYLQTCAITLTLQHLKHFEASSPFSPPCLAVSLLVLFSVCQLVTAVSHLCGFHVYILIGFFFFVPSACKSSIAVISQATKSSSSCHLAVIDCNQLINQLMVS